MKRGIIIAITVTLLVSLLVGYGVGRISLQKEVERERAYSYKLDTIDKKMFKVLGDDLTISGQSIVCASSFNTQCLNDNTVKVQDNTKQIQKIVSERNKLKEENDK